MNRLPLLAASATVALGAGIQSSDVIKLRSIGVVQLSPDGSRIAYTVIRNDGPSKPFPQIWIMTVSDGKSTPLTPGDEPSSDPAWSHDSRHLAYTGTLEGKRGLIVADADGTGKKFLAPMETTNSPIPNMGKTMSWSPDGKRMAYVTARPGPEAADLSGDPMVITRRFYKPSDKTGGSRFRDDKRLHIFVVDLATGQSTQLTDGTHHEHSIDWSPAGKEIAFVSNPEPAGDDFFNFDLFAVEVATKETRRLAATENAEYKPQWSPDGKSIVYEATKRGLNGLEVPMEDTHIWLIGADGANRLELGAAIDNRQQEPGWASDGHSVLSTVRERGSIALYRMPVNGGKPAAVVAQTGQICSWSAQGDRIAYALETPGDKAQLYLKTGSGAARKLTDLNHEVLKDKKLGRVEPFTYISNDHKWTVEAFLTYPANFQDDGKYPLITVIHGGPHFQQGPSFDIRNQVYASRGWATLMVNYRGSVGYGQAFADAVFGDQDGREAQDVLYGVSAAMRRYAWIDRDRLGIEGVSYGGQLTAWLITQTNMFKAAVPTAAVINLISYNYTTNYQQFEQMEWGQRTHEGNLMDVLWERSPMKYVAQAHTPAMLVHGENDNDVPIGESEQFYAALRDVGTDALMVRYPREGHGIHEPKHIVDWIDRSIQWYEKYFR